MFQMPHITYHFKANNNRQPMEHVLQILSMHYVIMSAETHLSLFYRQKKIEEGLQSLINLPLSFVK